MGITRRDFLATCGALFGTSVLTGCGGPVGGSPLQAITEPRDVEPVIDPRHLEKPDLRIGFVPVNDCAPFAIAYTQGFFRKYGLRVQLSREASWATSRDGVIFGRLDASPVVSGAIVNARLGAEGAIAAPLCAAMTIHRHGNAITFNRAMWDSGVRPLAEYGGDLERLGADLRRHLASLPESRRVFAVVLSSAIYEYFLRHLLISCGIVPDRDVRLIIIPPPQMVSTMRIGTTQGYMVAEPWNTRAIAGNEGVGFTFAQGSELWRGHPDRLLAVTEPFIDRYPHTYRALVMAMVEACQWCDRNRLDVSETIAARAFTGAPSRFTAPALVGPYNAGGFDDQDRRRYAEDHTLFFDLPVDLQENQHDHSTFLWRSQAVWLMTQAVRWGQVAELPPDIDLKTRRAWRSDLYRSIVADLGISCPTEDFKIEPADRFFDGIPFDPNDPAGYLASLPGGLQPRRRGAHR